MPLRFCGEPKPPPGGGAPGAEPKNPGTGRGPVVDVGRPPPAGGAPPSTVGTVGGAADDGGAPGGGKVPGGSVPGGNVPDGRALGAPGGRVTGGIEPPGTALSADAMNTWLHLLQRTRMGPFASLSSPTLKRVWHCSHWMIIGGLARARLGNGP